MGFLLDKPPITGPGTGDVSGPGVAVVDNALVRWDGTSGTLVQSSPATLDDLGNLTVTTLTIVSEVQTTDNLIVLNSDVVAAPSEDAGIEINRGSSTDARVLWNETTDRWQVGLAGSETNIIIGSDLSTVATSGSHLDLSNIGTNSHASIDTHIASVANPHAVTATQVGNTTAQWNANQLEGVDISNTAPTNNQILRYNAGASEWQPQTVAIGSTKTLWFTSNTGATYGSYLVDSAGTGSSATMTFHFPADWTATTSLVAVGIVGTGANATARNIDLVSNYASSGEVYTTNSQSDTTSTYDLSGTVDTIREINIAPVFTGAAAGDYAGILITHNAIGGTIRYLGIRLTYT
jgi:hypothetical protein